MTLNFVTVVVSAFLLVQFVLTQVVIKETAKDGIEVIDRDPNRGNQVCHNSLTKA